MQASTKMLRVIGSHMHKILREIVSISARSAPEFSTYVEPKNIWQELLSVAARSGPDFNEHFSEVLKRRS